LCRINRELLRGAKPKILSREFKRENPLFFFFPLSDRLTFGYIPILLVGEGD